ncbi:MAG: thiamine diphosphokinase [Opitutales bacterium]|nr:thiamine diphosphokinase [Opitutales bacterium]
MILDISNYQSILCLDGELPFSFLQQTALPMVATDGAANKLVAHGLKPSCIVGDLDSVEPSLLKQYPYVRDANQDATDFEKALSYLKRKNLLPTIVVGLSGGCLDRVLTNMSIWLQSNAAYVSEDLVGFPLRQDGTFDWPINAKVSLLGGSNGVVTSQGLRWELHQTTLAFGGFCSCSNRVQSSPVTLQVQGTILVFVYRNPVHDAGSLESD